MVTYCGGGGGHMADEVGRGQSQRLGTLKFFQQASHHFHLSFHYPICTG